MCVALECHACGAGACFSNIPYARWCGTTLVPAGAPLHNTITTIGHPCKTTTLSKWTLSLHGLLASAMKARKEPWAGSPPRKTRLSSTTISVLSVRLYVGCRGVQKKRQTRHRLMTGSNGHASGIKLLLFAPSVEDFELSINIHADERRQYGRNTDCTGFGRW